MKATPENLFNLVRRDLPNPTSIRGFIPQEFAMQEPATPIGELKTIQRIQVFDPREIIDGGDHGDKVQIRRILQRVPVNTTTSFHIVPTKILEVIRVYSFEEWDAGLGLF